MSDLTKICEDYIERYSYEFLSGCKNIYKNNYYNFGSFTLFLTTKGGYCIISNEDGDLLNYIWSDSNSYCLNATQGYMHRLIMKRLHPNVSDEFDVDHIDQNKFNNTRANLRYVTRSNNLRNRSVWCESGISGLCDVTEENRFRCQRSANGVRYSKSYRYGKVRSYEEAYQLALIWLKEFDNDNPIQSITK
jgi:hypothetical protein